jgi:hypothetical protein
LLTASLRRIMAKMPCISMFSPGFSGMDAKPDPGRVRALHQNLRVNSPGLRFA